MPALILNSNVKLEDAASKLLIAELSKTIAKVMGKPEAYVLVGYQHSTMIFGGVDQPCAFG